MKQVKGDNMKVGSFEGHGPGYFIPSKSISLKEIRNRTIGFLKLVDKAHKDAANSTLRFGDIVNERT